MAKKKGTFVDGHERDDVVLYHETFLRRMVGLGFLNPNVMELNYRCIICVCVSQAHYLIRSSECSTRGSVCNLWLLGWTQCV